MFLHTTFGSARYQVDIEVCSPVTQAGSSKMRNIHLRALTSYSLTTVNKYAELLDT